MAFPALLNDPALMALHEVPAATAAAVRSSPAKPKAKPKRPPQRGLGVAQLEKIRLEEQQKSNAAAAAAAAAIVQPESESQKSGAVIPPPFDPNPLVRNSAATVLAAAEGGKLGVSGSSGHGFLPMLWNSADPAARDQIIRRYLSQQQQQQQQQQSSSNPHQKRQQQHRLDESHPLLVNKTLSQSSSGVSLQMEPPSNQSYCSNYNPMPSPWPDEQRMVGMKRLCPFRLESMPNLTSYPCKITKPASSFIEPDHTVVPIHGNDMIKLEPMSLVSRGCISSSSAHQVDWRSPEVHVDKSKEENGASADSGFLTLGPSLAPSLPSKTKQSIVLLSPNQCGNSQLGLISYQESVDDDTSSISGSVPPPPFYTFLPLGKNTQESILGDRRGEVMEALDLNLKL